MALQPLENTPRDQINTPTPFAPKTPAARGLYLPLPRAVRLCLYAGTERPEFDDSRGLHHPSRRHYHPLSIRHSYPKRAQRRQENRLPDRRSNRAPLPRIGEHLIHSIAQKKTILPVCKMVFFCGQCVIHVAPAIQNRFMSSLRGLLYLSSSTAACAAARRAIGTRKGEQEA